MTLNEVQKTHMMQLLDTLSDQIEELRQATNNALVSRETQALLNLHISNMRAMQRLVEILLE